MAYTPPEVFGKITTVSSKAGSNINETLGYTDINVYDATSEEWIRKLQQFTTGQVALTTNTYTKSAITYEVQLDTLEID